MKAKPLKITFDLAFPLMLNHRWIHLDGIIGHLIWHRANDPNRFDCKAPTPIDEKKFKRTITLKDGIPCASVGVFEEEDYRAVNYVKRPEPDLMSKGKLDIASGYFRAWRLAGVYNPSLQVTFYAHGRKDLLEELFADLTHLGDNIRMGWGLIKRMQIEQIDHDCSIMRDGVAMRPIPVEAAREYECAYPLAWKPPFWAAENVRLCVPPGAKVRLK